MLKLLRYTLLILFILLTIACASDDLSETQEIYDAYADMFSIDLVYDAQKVLQDIIEDTPLLHSAALSDDADVYLKLECVQVTGSFKVRGAYYAISRLTPEEKEFGVATNSAGNHAQGVSLAANAFGINATIFMPETAPRTKIDAVTSYGVDVRVGGANFSEAKKAVEDFIFETGATYIPPYDSIDIISGQGTIALEVWQQNPGVDIIVVPIGGGGLASGIAGTIKALNPSVIVYGVEEYGMSGMLHSFEVGKPSAVTLHPTLADGMAVAAPSDLTFAICQRYVDEVVTVTEEQIAAAIVFMYNEYGLVVEGAGAVTVAAVMNDLIPVMDKNVVCIVSGGNIDRDVLERLIRESAS